MSRNKPKDLRDPDRKPDRLLSKEDGLRQIIHAAIRMTLSSEDAYATHLLIRSADSTHPAKTPAVAIDRGSTRLRCCGGL